MKQSIKLTNRTEQILFWLIVVGAILILFTPLIISQRTFYPFIFGKVIAVRILIEIIVAFYLLLALAFPKYRPNWKNPLLIALTVFLGIYLLSSLFGADFQRSFWSTQERMAGFFTMLHYWLFFIVIINVFREKKQWHWLLRMNLLATCLVSLYALGQKIGIKGLLETGQERITGTIGNPNFIAAYLLFSLFLIVILWIWEKKIIWKITYLIVFALQLTMLIFSMTRSATIGLAGGLLLLFFLLTFFSFQKKQRLIFCLILLLIIGGVAFIWLNKENDWVKENRYLVRLTNLSMVTHSGQSRLMTWQSGWQGWKERPLLGWGPENFNLAFNKYYNPEFARYGSTATWSDRAHNFIFDLGVTSGWLGLISWLAIFVVAIYYLWHRRKRIGLVISSVLISLLVAYLLQNLFNFDTPATYLLLFFTLGLISVYCFAKQEVVVKKNNQCFFWPVLISLLILTPIIIYHTNLKPYQSSRQGALAMAASKVNHQMGMAFFQQSLLDNTFVNPEMRMQLAKVTLQSVGKEDISYEDRYRGLRFAIEEMEKNVKTHSQDVRYALFLAQLNNAIARYQSDYLKQADTILTEMLSTDLTRHQLYYELSRTKVLQQEYDQAIDLLRQAVLLAPDIKEAHWNLAMIYLIAGQTKLGLNEAEKAVELEYYYHKDKEILLYLAKAYLSVKNYQSAIDHYKWAIKLGDDIGQLYFELVPIYVQFGDKASARIAAKAAKEKNPNLTEQVDKFLRGL